MNNKMRHFDDRLEVYENAKGLLYFYVLGGLAFGAFAFLFLYVALTDDNAKPFFAFGTLFAMVAVVILLGLPKGYRDMTNDAGAIAFSVNEYGISIRPSRTDKLGLFLWEDISSISLSRRMKIIEQEGWGGQEWQNFKDVLVVYFNNTMPQERLTLLTESILPNTWKSPKGSRYATARLPKNSVDVIATEIGKLSSGTCSVNQYEKIIFNYAKKTEQFQV